MNYQFENLGDERFQEFCHCLINKNFPNTQAFPIGQPDGGRDSISYFMASPKKDFIVFQVKYVRNPNKIQDTHKWLTETISKEIKKINKLIPKGAQSYYLLTNVKGTAHLDVGSIDKLNKILEDNISIPSLCWWGDDLSRMVDSDPLFKWSYPEILNGQDVLNSALFQNLNEHKERRENVIKAYLVDQYEMDNQVKFKQIDLQNNLFQLFTDVPIQLKKFNPKNKLLQQILNTLSINHNKRITNRNEYFILEDIENIGAAEFLLNPIVQNGIDRILLEGGPGQGKSTIAQFICQVHRARLLERNEHLQLIDENLINTPLRIPFKIDLRHIASWVEKINPYKDTLSDDYFNSIWQNSLEAFLVGHIFYHSSIKEFTSSDLIAIFKISHILLVFDGFDEIANFNVRSDVVDFINKGLNRLSQNCDSMQVLITSRPAAFSDATSFSIDQYPHFELTDITPTIIKEYVGKWVKACGLSRRESNEIKRLVEEKLQLPHLRDLAKSPMQLAIFISLLRTKGEALPNKRTALYDSYINLFFDRESEKSVIIRDNRDLIIDIHQYLAWILHSESELYKTSGIIQVEDLKQKLNEYLTKEEHNTDIADIFKVVEERVCALVSRVQGTFEFEVQPLREYFCAKYLFKTAPYSPPGVEKSGTKPDRFEAISHNFYWQNVLRFFAGCFDVGELPMLTQKSTDLFDDDIIKFTNYPYILISQLLSDYVFAQSPRNQRDAINIIINGIKTGSLSYQDSRIYNNERISLPPECGGKELILECFNQLKKFPKDDYAYELIRLIIDNPYDIVKHWQNHSSNFKSSQLTKWLEYALRLQIIDKLDEKILNSIIKPNSDDLAKRLQILFRGNYFNILDKNIQLKEIALTDILNSKISYLHHKNVNHSLLSLTTILNPYILTSIIKEIDVETSVLHFLQRRNNYYQIEESISNSIIKFPVSDSVDNNINEFIKSINSELKENVSIWKRDIKPWDNLVENGRKLFGENWSFSIVAVIAAGIKQKNNFIDYNELSDNSKSLCKRVRFARMKSGNIKYWKNHFSNSKFTDLTLLTFFTWATPKTILNLIPILSQIVDSLPQDRFLKIYDGISKTSSVSIFNKSQQLTIDKAIKANNVSDTFICLLSTRLKYQFKEKFIYENISDFKFVPDDIINAKMGYLINEFLYNSSNIGILEEIKDCYSIIRGSYQFRYLIHRNWDKIKMPLNVSEIILNDNKSYPREIISIAEMTYRMEVNKHLTPVGQIAQQEKWFD